MSFHVIESLKLYNEPAKQVSTTINFIGQTNVNQVKPPVQIIDKRNVSKINRDIIIDKICNQHITTCNIPIPNIENTKPLQIIEIEKPIVKEPMVVEMEKEPTVVETVKPTVKPGKKLIIKPKKPVVIETEKEPIVVETEKEPVVVETEKEPVVVETEKEPIVVETEKEPIVVETEKEPIVIKPKRKTRKIKQVISTDDIETEIDLTNTIIRTQKVSDRLPTKMPLKVNNVLVETQRPVYYMENRKLYLQKLENMFKPYEKEILEQFKTITCDNRSKNINFDLLTHQKVIREYLNLYTPYRGLLLYHGLGSGKTCSSIAIAEGMKSNKHIFIMTPASLKQNYLNQMKECGDALYKKNQYWEFIPIDENPEYINILSKALSLPREYIRQNKGAWLVNINKSPNFATLDTNSQNMIDDQITEMIHSKYTDLNYNGLNEKIMERITENSTKNPFDNSVVIIDEAHNFVSRIVNKVKTKDSISYRLYDYLMNAKNARIVLLTGTPIINHPNELAILFNILRGYIISWTIPIKNDGGVKINTDNILEILDDAKINTFDYVNVSGNEITITRNPYGFINTKKRGVLKSAATKKNIKNPDNKTRKIMVGGSDVLERYNGITLDEAGNISNEQFLNKVLKSIKPKMEVMENQIVEHKYTALPQDSKEFMQLFVDTSKSVSLTNKDEKYFKNVELFQRRILGLTSYFKSLEQLLPRLDLTDSGNIYHIEYTEMSKMQFDTYVEIRKEEVEKDKKMNKMKHNKANADEAYNISSSYRIFSRAACNFVFPSHIKRPSSTAFNKPSIEQEEEPIVETENIMNDLEVSDNTFDKQVEETIDLLTNSTPPEINEPPINYLLEENLKKYCSPKFARILENLKNEVYSGLHLIYSAFRTLEGIGILRRILLENGFAEFKIIYQNGEWKLDENPEDIEKPKFVLHTGTESVDEKEIILNIYNGKWDYVPSNISNILRERAETNLMGEIIKVLMITASGAEGINLLNTRYVHIVEPYWHMARLDQVVGRARRICSHNALPVELQTVKVFLYISRLNISSINSNIELINRDISKFDDKTPVATDEALYELSLMKQMINNEFLSAIQSTAVDCELYSSSSSTSKCYSLGLISSNDFASFPDIEQDKRIKQDLNVKMKKITGRRFEYENNSYVYNEDANEIYTWENYNNVLSNKENIKVIGKFEIINGKKVIKWM